MAGAGGVTVSKAVIRSFAFVRLNGSSLMIPYVISKLKPLAQFLACQLYKMVQQNTVPLDDPPSEEAEVQTQNKTMAVHDHVLKAKKLSDKASLPLRTSRFAAGYDLSSAADVTIPARGKAMIPTDLIIELPEGTYAQIAPRSGLDTEHVIDVGVSVIEEDFEGPIVVLLYNHSEEDFEVKCGDLIAQLIVQKIISPVMLEL
ncbi:dUTPase-like [Dillenia turbinata]|uniref:Deoxyuridine 5'-triphosphate nucleotidohydrolase n=1 Tax=Dillenia turbinata TaxID=194707 RepID=A0AAN8V6F8_9MAGN